MAYTVPGVLCIRRLESVSSHVTVQNGGKSVVWKQTKNNTLFYEEFTCLVILTSVGPEKKNCSYKREHRSYIDTRQWLEWSVDTYFCY